MTGVFNIDLETEGFRRNNLDWRNFRDKYNKLSATKLERGIKPLPLTLLLKLFGPQKVLNTYVVTRRPPQELDYYNEELDVDYNSEMRAHDKDKPVAKTLDFPGHGIMINSEEINEVLRQSSTRLSKHNGLPTRPVLQRALHVPGRYFPKPSGSISDDGVSLAVPCVDFLRERPRTQTPRAITVLTPATNNSHQQHRPMRNNGFKGRSAVLSKNSKVIRGSVCKATDSLSSNHPSRAVSGKSTMTVKSMPAMSHTEYDQWERRLGVMSNGIITDGFEYSGTSGRHETNGELSVDVFNVKRLRLSARQVTFPKNSQQDFSTVLQGRPKTLHRRELTEYAEYKEPRAKTHVGFAESEIV